MKKITVILALFTLAILPHSQAQADEWRCRCGCADPLCINIEGECYATNRTNYLYDKNDSAYDDIDNENGTIVHTTDGLIVNNIKKNHSWGYYFELAPRSRHYLKWEGRLEVLDITGDTWAGITAENEEFGICFKVDASGRAALVAINLNNTADTYESFFLPRELRDIPAKGEFTLGLDYDVRTGILTASIDEQHVKTYDLRASGIPAFASVTSYAMQTSTPRYSNWGEVHYGTLTLEAY